MERRDPLEVSIVATSGRRPSLDQLAVLEEGWTEAAAAQLIAAAEAADGWLADHPDDAARLLHDPVSVITAMTDAGVLTEPVDDLLKVLRSRAEAGHPGAGGIGRQPGRVVRFVADRPSRSKGHSYPDQKGPR